MYKIVEDKPGFDKPFRVMIEDSMVCLSTYETLRQAKAAVKRYKAKDKRKARKLPCPRRADGTPLYRAAYRNGRGREKA